MSEWADRIQAQIKELREAVEGLHEENRRAGIVKRDEAAARRSLERGNRFMASVPGLLFDTVGSAAAAQAASQPLDSELTAIAALTTAAFGRGLLTETSAGTTRSTLGLGDAAILSVGTSAGTVAAGDDARFASQSFWSALGTLSAGTTYFAAPGGFTAVAAPEPKFPVPHACTVKNLYIRVGTAPGGSDTLIVTVRKNSSDQTLTVTLTGAATTGNDTTHTFSMAAGDILSISAVVSATGAPANLTIGLELAL